MVIMIVTIIVIMVISEVHSETIAQSDFYRQAAPRFAIAAFTPQGGTEEKESQSVRIWVFK